MPGTWGWRSWNLQVPTLQPKWEAGGNPCPPAEGRRAPRDGLAGETSRLHCLRRRWLTSALWMKWAIRSGFRPAVPQQQGFYGASLCTLPSIFRRTATIYWELVNFIFKDSLGSRLWVAGNKKKNSWRDNHEKAVIDPPGVGLSSLQTERLRP